MPSTPSTPNAGRLSVLLCIAALVTWRCGAWAASVVVVPHQQIGEATLEQSAALRGILRRIEAGDEHADMRRYFPEGGLFSLSFTGFALAAHAQSSGDDEEARVHILTLLERTTAERAYDPFASWGKGADWYGVIYEGHRNLLRAAYVELGGDDARVLADFHRETADLARRFLSAPSGNLESFPHQVWPVDNIVALESLRLHDVRFGAGAATTAIERWRAAMRQRIDRKTGMFVSEIDVRGSLVRDGPRGCALSWMLAFLPSIDAELARAMWQRYARTWSVDVVGMRGLREWPPGVNGHIDADTGPIVYGIGGAASAFGVAAAQVNDDGAMFGRMLLPLEILTAPSFTWRGEKELFGGHVLFADVLSVWAKTWRPLDQRTTRSDEAAPVPIVPIVPTLLALVVLLAPIALAWRAVWRARTESRDGWPIALAVLVVVVAFDLALPIAVVLLWLVGRVSSRK